MNIDKVAILIKKAALEFDKVSNQILAEYYLTASQFKVLKFLYSAETRTAKVCDIERHYSMTHPTTIGLLDNLEKKGFINRIVNPEDARSKQISLTEKAVNLEGEIIEVGDKIEDKLTENLTQTEKAELVKLLQKLLGI